MFSVSCIRPQTPHVCIPCIIYSITLWYLTSVHLGHAMVPRYVTLVCISIAYTPCHTPPSSLQDHSPTQGHVMGPTAPTLWYPHISPSRLRHGTQVYCYGIGQSRIYTIPYPHLAAYMAIALTKGTLWCPQP